MSLIQGRLRGYPIYLDTVNLAGGHYTTVKEFIGTNRNAVIDSGNKTNKHDLKIFIKDATIDDEINDHDTSRDDFIEVLRAEGSSELSHPFFGLINVQVGDWSISQNEKIGYTIFSVSLVEIQDEQEEVFDLKYEIDTYDKDFKEGMNSTLTNEVNVDSLSDVYFRAIVGTVTDQLKKVSDLKSTLDYSHYVKKVDSLISLVTNKEYWSNMYDFYNSYFDFTKHFSTDTKNFLKKLLNQDRLFLEGHELSENVNFVNETNKQTEAIKLFGMSKLLRFARNGDMSDSDVDYVISHLNYSIDNLIFESMYENLLKMRNLFYLSKRNEETKIHNVEESTPLLVIANKIGKSVEELAEKNNIYDVNEVKGEVCYV